MKKLVLAALLISAISVQAQEKRLNVYGAYVFDDSFDTYFSSTDYYTGKIKGGFQWGAGVEFMVKENFGAELLYYHQDTQVPVTYYNFTTQNRTIDAGINYYLLGLTRYVKKGKAEPFGGLLLGAGSLTNKSPQGTEQSSITKFAVGFRLGVNVWATERVAIKLQAQLLTAVQGFGGGVYFGTGGSGASVGTYSTITQLGLGGGLTFKIGE